MDDLAFALMLTEVAGNAVAFIGGGVLAAMVIRIVFEGIRHAVWSFRLASLNREYSGK